MLEILSRAQFGFSIGFHILFPTLNLGLAIFLVYMEARWLKTKNPMYREICQFWTKIFALTFGMGVVSGIVLAYQIGTNFGPFIAKFGNILGALFAYETITAFFLEAGFLGIMLFGWQRVPPFIHFMATLLVAIGTTISAFWILSANSWMQTPSGYVVEHGQYIVGDWWQVVFNPSFIPRLIHMLIASYISSGFLIAAVSAYFLLKNKHVDIAKTSLSFCMACLLILTPLQVVMGDVVGLKVLHYQPIKTAAMEALWETQKGAPLVLFALPDQKEQKNNYEIAIPKLASLINTHSLDGEMQGLRSIPLDKQPPVMNVFINFRVMVGLGLLMVVTALMATWLRLRGKLYTSSWFHRWLCCMAPAGFLATIAGWLTAEFGRQPWTVHGLMLTREAISKVSPEEVLISFTLLVITYLLIFSFYLYYVAGLIKKGPKSSLGNAVEQHAFQYMTDLPPKNKE